MIEDSIDALLLGGVEVVLFARQVPADVYCVTLCGTHSTGPHLC